MRREMDKTATVDMLKQVSKSVIDNVDKLTDADLAIGDGDHGIGMRRGFEATLDKLEDDNLNSIEDVFKSVGTAIMTKTGGAAGAIFGTLFRSGSKALVDCDVLTAKAFAEFLELALISVANRGNVVEGQKTMLDALAPAARNAKASAPDGDLFETMTSAATGAEEGVEETRNMIATTGKARSLGERSLGHPDPGAISVAIILAAMRDYIGDMPAKT